MAKNRRQSKKKDNGAVGLFIPAGLFIGFGLGFFFNNVPAGMFCGLGAGFLLFAIAVLMKK
ncbi:MAG: hypothetical protein V1900_01160 [Candidatus Aenigmatarchaeota archaeon]